MKIKILHFDSSILYKKSLSKFIHINIQYNFEFLTFTTISSKFVSLLCVSIKYKILYFKAKVK